MISSFILKAYMIPNHPNLHQRLIGQPNIRQTMAQHDDSVAITNQRYLTYYVHSPSPHKPSRLYE